MAETKKIKKTKEVVSEESKKYWEGVGRRKTSVARVRIFTVKPSDKEEGRILVNGVPYKEYFKKWQLDRIVEDALVKLKSLDRFEATVKISGGGVNSQAEAIRHGIARSLVQFNADFRKKLKRAGFLKRDPRRKERRKPGLKKARRAPQWSKR